MGCDNVFVDENIDIKDSKFSECGLSPEILGKGRHVISLVILHLAVPRYPGPARAMGHCCLHL